MPISSTHKLELVIAVMGLRATCGASQATSDRGARDYETLFHIVRAADNVHETS